MELFVPGVHARLLKFVVDTTFESECCVLDRKYGGTALGKRSEFLETICGESGSRNTVHVGS